MTEFLTGYYNKLVFKYSWAILLVLVFITAVSAYYSKDFELDASSDSLVLEKDKSLEYYRTIREKYGADDFLIVTYTPYTDLLSEESLSGLKSLRDQFLQLDSVKSIVSILDIPIIYNSNQKLSELKNNLKTIESGEVGKSLAETEFQTNPFYTNLLVSDDLSTTALQIVFHPDDEYYDLLERRSKLREKSINENLSKLEKTDLEKIDKKIKAHNAKSLEQREIDIESIRKIMDSERVKAKLYLGGIPMITTDMIRFIKHDLIIFGIGVLLFLILVLLFFFRTTTWVMLPLFCCLITGILMIGFLGMAGWSVTVISSNFLSLLLIITLSLTIHLIVRYRDLNIESPTQSHTELIQNTVNTMAKPCFYTILTTAVAFASLIVSEIRPVIDFGYIMVIGLGIAYVTGFLLFPAVLAVLPSVEAPAGKDITRTFMLNIARIVNHAPRTIIYICIFLIIFVGTGITKLKVENRFIDNFKSSTEIYQGMKVIDQKLGGTTPLDIIIDPDQAFYEIQEELEKNKDDLDELFSGTAADQSEPNYWLNQTMIEKIRKIQNHLETYPTIGKVLSIATSIDIVERLNKAPLDDFELALIRKRVPEDVTQDLVDPYLSNDANQVRFSIRAIETDPTLNRKQLLDSIHDFLVTDMEFESDQVHLTGMLVLYNNMLQSLYRSQILTIGAVFLAIFLTFVVIFRSLVLAVLGIIPNIFSAVLVLGIMGWLGIPLDMMTITIAAITIGISVDDTIHYLHRLKHEYPVDLNYQEAIKRCHTGIGKAMYYTSLAIIFGFGILAFSNFIPTIYFGLLTGFAMLVALAGDLLFLPAIILITKPDIAAITD